MIDAPICRCGRQMRVDCHFKLDHETGDHPGTTMQLTEYRAQLEAVGAWGAEATVYYCESCDVAEVLFAYPEEAQ